MKLVHHFASNQIELVSILTTSWNPLAGATNDVIEDVKNILGNKEDQGVVDLQSALEVSCFHASASSPYAHSSIQDGDLFERQTICGFSDCPDCRK